MLAQKLLPLLLLAAVAAAGAAPTQATYGPLQQSAEDESSPRDKLIAVHQEKKIKKIIHQVNINDFIDENIGAIREALFQLDPTDLLDVKFPVTSHIYMNLHTGWLQNLSLLKRAGRSMLTYTNKLITADLTLGWDEIAFDYRYLLKVLLVSRQGDLHGQLSQLKVNVVIDVDLESYQVTLRRLDLSDSGKVTISLEGHILDKIYNLVLKAVTKVCKRLVVNTIQSKASNIIQSKMDEINEKISKNHNVMFKFVNLVEEEPVPAAILYNKY